MKTKHPREQAIERAREAAFTNAPRVAPRIDGGKLAQDIARRKAQAKAESAAIQAELLKLDGEPDHIPSRAEPKSERARHASTPAATGSQMFWRASRRSGRRRVSMTDQWSERDPCWTIEREKYTLG